MKYKGIEFQTVVNVKSDILTMSLNSRGASRENFKKALDLDFEFKSVFYFETIIAYDIKELISFSNLVEERLNKDKKYLYTLPKRTYGLADELISYSKSIKKIKNFSNYSNHDLQELFLSFMSRAESAFPLILISIPIETIIITEIETFIKERLQKRNEVDIFDFYYQAITQRSTRETFFQQEFRNLLTIGKKIQEDKTTLRKFKEASSVEIIAYLQGYNKKLYKK